MELCWLYLAWHNESPVGVSTSERALFTVTQFSYETEPEQGLAEASLFKWFPYWSSVGYL